MLSEGRKVKRMKCTMIPVRGKEMRRMCRKVPVKVCGMVPCRSCSSTENKRLECSYEPRKVCQRTEGAACRAGHDVP